MWAWQGRLSGGGAARATRQSAGRLPRITMFSSRKALVMVVLVMVMMAGMVEPSPVYGYYRRSSYRPRWKSYRGFTVCKQFFSL
ncbi:hypothetical protein Hamer_G024243 [Homarus americanus]|uniref:Uncharacterized protein n=1 Tax=Homarus americanus TaxID=6706 RepID=A0A8J5NAW7_HOMAM|nr:hypothetical protein Hamer_G024243 [Homarus americanus]